MTRGATADIGCSPDRETTITDSARERERKRWKSCGEGAAILQRRDFLAAARSGMKKARTGLVLQARPNGRQSAPSIRVGLTASRKVGNSVIRNRAKRRLRALARDVLMAEGSIGFDYVLIARASTVDRPFDKLEGDLRSCLKQLGLHHPSTVAVAQSSVPSSAAIKATTVGNCSDTSGQRGPGQRDAP